MATQRLLIIGVGSIGERHLRCALRIECAEIAICEVDDKQRKSVALRYGIKAAYADVATAIAARPTAAIVCVPAHLHVAIAAQLVDAGVHVLIEKPLSTSLDGMQPLEQAIRRHNVVVAVAYVLRANPNLACMRAALSSGKFGKPVQLVAVAGQNFPFYRPAYRSTYYRNRSTGGGAIQDALTHLINASEWLIGPIDRIMADACHRVIPDVDVEDTVHVLARHGDVPAAYAINQYQSPNEISITVVCEQGTLRCELHENRWRWMTEPGNEWHNEPGPPLQRDDLFVAQLTAFFGAIEQRRPPLCTFEEGLQSFRVNLALLRFVESTKWACV